DIVPKLGSLPVEALADVWLENTKSAHQHGGPGWEFGTCLWSPSKDRGDRDFYSTMRDVAAGDLVIHCQDSTLVGYSFVREPYQEIEEEPPSPGVWVGQSPYYKVLLREYHSFPQAVTLPAFFEQHAVGIRQDVEELGSTKGYPFFVKENG